MSVFYGFKITIPIEYFQDWKYTIYKAVISLYHGYKTVKEAAEAWGVTIRYVNMCIADGRVSGAVRVGNMWLIPKDAERPVSRHGKREPRDKGRFSDLAYVIESAWIPAPHDKPDAIVDMVAEERLRILPKMGLAYARGDFEQIKRNFCALKGDEVIKLCACAVTIPAAISLGDYAFFREVETYLKGVAEANPSAAATAFAELILAGGYLGAGAPDMIPDWLKNGDFSALPPRAKQNAAYMRVQYFRWQNNYELMLAVAQTSLALCASEQGLTYEETYLLLFSAAACCALGRHDDAKRYVLDALRKNMPHGFITPFVELAPLLGGLLERLLAQEFPAQQNAIMAQWKRTFVNWIAFHNHFTKDNITLILTLREYEIARLAARRVPYAQIAEQQCISVSRLKGIMDVIHGKLFVRNREELARFIL